MIIQRLSDLDWGSSRVGGVGKSLKVCVVSLLGLAKNGGIGAASHALIKHLASDGHQVTLLYTLVDTGSPVNVAVQSGPSPEQRTWQQWVEALATEGIVLELIPHEGPAKAWLEKSWLVMEFLRKRDFDVVYFDDWHGSGYYSQLAKQSGLAPFSKQLHFVMAHASKQWVCASNDEFIHAPSDILVAGMERRSVEMADVLIGPSRYILREYASYGWRLPNQTFQQFLAFPSSPPVQKNTAKIRIDELVFFGRLEVRKGLWLFCDALDRLAERLEGRVVTFLGPIIHTHGLSTGVQLLNRSANWPFRINVLADFNTDQALAYLKQGNRLAVMPSLADNSPLVVYECLSAGVPFLTTRGTGTEELIHKDCWPDLLAEATVDSLTEKLSRILDSGVAPGRASFDSRENLKAWSNWHRQVAANSPKSAAAEKAAELVVGAKAEKPLIVIVDRGKCSLGLLVQNLMFHAGRFGNVATFFVLSARSSLVQTVTAELLKGVKATVRVFGFGEIDEASTLIRTNELAFFMDAEVEMLAAFFVLALESLARKQSAAVTCVGAVRRRESAATQIEQLPSGDIPGLSAFGQRIGGPVWATSPARHSEVFADVKLYDKRMDALISAAAAGEHFMQRCRLMNGVVELIPMVGAVETMQEGAQEQTLEDQHDAISVLDIQPSLQEGGAAWFAISTFGPSETAAEQVLPRSLSSLSQDHPLTKWLKQDSVDLSTLAAAIGRPELALQLDASNGGSSERTNRLVETAIEAARRRPTLTLSDLLIAAKAIRFGQTPNADTARTDDHPQIGRDAGNVDELQKRGTPIASGQAEGSEAARTASADPKRGVKLFADRRLRIEDRKIQSTASLRQGGPAKLFFFDVPLSANSSLDVKLRSMGRDAVLVRARVVDQTSGEEIGTVSARVDKNSYADLSIPLFEIYGEATIALEFSGATNMRMIAEVIRVR